jgi:hypothetical protein
MSKSCETCLRGPEPTRRLVCIDCGDDLVNFIALRHVDEPDEARMDVIGQNGNDGLHYLDPNVERVMAQLSTRAKAGLLKYGTDTTRQDLTRAQWLKHAQEEALDLAVYLERLIQQEQTA